MDITIDCGEVQVESTNRARMVSVTITGVDSAELLDQIGKQTAIEYFGIEEAKE